MLISEFAREVELSVDTVRFYVRKGLISPELGQKGGSNPYQIFTSQHVETVRLIRTAQLLGFSLKQISALSDQYKADAAKKDGGLAIMESQLQALQEKSANLTRLISYFQAKIAWIQRGSVGAEPQFDGSSPCLTVSGAAHSSAADDLAGGVLGEARI